MAERSASNSLTGVYQRLLDAHWFYAGIGQLAQDDEFGLDLRVLGGAAYGRFLVRTNEQELALAGGVAAAREYLRDDTVEDGVEGLAAREVRALPLRRARDEPHCVCCSCCRV